MTDATINRQPHVVFVGDGGIVEPLCVAASSLRRASSFDEIALDVLAVDWTAADRQRCHSLLGDGVEIIDVDRSRLPGIRSGRHVTSAAYALFLVPEMLDSVQRVLYLDADVLVRNGRVDELWSIDLSGHPVGASPAIGQAHIAASNGITGWRVLGLDPRAPMLNSGVLVLDLDAIRASGVFERALGYAHGYAEFSFLADQHALNAALNGDWLRLEPIFNSNYRRLGETSGAYLVFDDAEITAAVDDPVIVHFVGRDKPWMQIAGDRYIDEWRSQATDLGIENLIPVASAPTKAELNRRIDELTARTGALEAEIQRLQTSRPYRLGRTITAPGRALRNLRSRRRGRR